MASAVTPEEKSLLKSVCFGTKLYEKRSLPNGRKKKIKELAVELHSMSERQKEISLSMLALWGYMGDPSSSKQVSAVLPQGEEMRKYKNKTIKRRADGRYWARYYKDGKQHSVYGKTVDECLLNLKKALKGKNTPQKPKTVLFGEWLEKWLKLYKEPRLKASTLYQTKRYVAKLTQFFKTPITQLTTLQLQTFLLAEEKPRNREHLFNVLRDSLNKAVKNDLIPKNPCDNVELPKHKAKQSKALTHDEESRFVEKCKLDPYGLQYLLCLFQGLRIGETQLLTMVDFDLNNKTMRIDKSLNDLYKPDTPKSETSIRTLPLFQRTIDALKTLPFKMAKSDKQIYQHFRSICDKADVSGVTVHSLRHTFATRCAEAGIAPNTTKQWMGHSTIDLTLNVYTHVNKDFEQKETAKFDTYFDT